MYGYFVSLISGAQESPAGYTSHKVTSAMIQDNRFAVIGGTV